MSSRVSYAGLRLTSGCHCIKGLPVDGRTSGTELQYDKIDADSTKPKRTDDGAERLRQQDIANVATTRGSVGTLCNAVGMTMTNFSGCQAHRGIASRCGRSD
jgi:hypothetical protein